MKKRGICIPREMIILIGLCLFFNLYKILFSILFANPSMQTPQDGFSTLYSVAYFAGNDWTNVGREYSEYYGWGYVVFFSWLYRIFTDGLMVYRIILLCANLLVIVSCCFCYKIVNMFDVVKNQTVKYFICIAVTSIQGSCVWGISNEYMLNVCIWIVFYLILRLCDTELPTRKRAYITVILFFLVAYSCTVHARAVAIYFLVGFCCAVVLIKDKFLMIHPIAALGTGTLYIMTKIVSNKLQMVLLGEISSNSSIIAKASNGMGTGVTKEKIVYFLMSIVIYLHELNVIAIGMATVCVAILIFYFIQVKKKNKVFRENDICERRLISGFIYGILGIGVFIIGMCFSNNREIYRGFTAYIGQHLRYLTLVRYFMPFVAPTVLMTIIAIMAMERNYRKKIITSALAILGILQLIFFVWIYPYINYTGWANNVYLPYTWDKPMERNEVYLVGGILVPMIFMLLNCIQIRKENWILLCFSIYIFCTIGMMYRYMHQYTEDNEIECIDGGYSYFKDDKVSKNIYVVGILEDDEGNKEIDDMYYFLYQMFLPNMRIIPGNPPEDEENAIVLTNSIWDVHNYKTDYEMILLDDNEWLLMKKQKDVLNYKY